MTQARNNNKKYTCLPYSASFSLFFPSSRRFWPSKPSFTVQVYQDTKATFQDITYWNHDYIPSHNDELFRAFHWLIVANAVLERINNNAYKLDLPEEYRVSITFNIFYLIPFVGGVDIEEEEELKNLRSNPLQRGGNDAILSRK
ncbi:hypothetical protein D0Y65_045126 [Glycine soja]|uniref:Uncharacterized protein n=1 Tax=Glycine soja TaxID=3848 RepID=A0A445G382_GLYSO|nr:hypothetical protein D0Y65_045126 [Glycine soja]RZB55668.1 hypothetical protein D0Y65_045126 [Glycine soja]